MDFLTSVNQSLKEHGIDFVVEPQHIGAGFVRFDNRGGTNNAWVVLEGNDTHLFVGYGDFKQGIKGQLTFGNLSKQTLYYYTKKHKRYKEKLLNIAKEDIKRAWNTYLISSTHPYLVRKGLKRLHGAKVELFPGTTTPENVIVPMRLSPDGDIVNLQSISENGVKTFYTGGETEAACFFVGSKEPETLYICEGYATGVSVYEALGEPDDALVVCTMSASNIPDAAIAMANLFKTARVVFLADNDHTKKENAGLSYATKASALVSGSQIIHPPSEDGVSDFNDYTLRHGAEETKKLITSKIPSEVVPVERAEISQVAKKPNENMVAHVITQNLENTRVLEGELYTYTGSYWRVWEEQDYSELRNEIRKVSSKFYKTGDVNSCYQAILDFLPRAPKTLLYPKYTMANFSNGTLHLIETRTGHHFDFRPHNPDDGLLYLIPYDYTPELILEKSPSWENYLQTLFSEDPDRDEKIAALSEMFGAILMPRYPRLFMLHGESGCGKSTIILTALRFMRNEDIGGVDPTRFGREFYLEPLVGKVINAVTDICTTSPISDDIIKQIEDQTPFFVNRKGKKAIRAPLPPIHIFGGNGIPKTLDGASHAHERRWTFIKFSKKVALQEDMDKNYSRWLFEDGAQGILGFALRGLQRLIKKKGIYTQPSSGKQTMSEWQTEADSVGQFIEDIKEKNIDHVYLVPGGKIKTQALWDAFQAWADDTNSSARTMGRNSFFVRIQKHGFVKRREKDTTYFLGFTTEKSQAHPF